MSDYLLYDLSYVNMNLNFSNLAIGNAFSVLNDPAKREKYDAYSLQAAKNKDSYPARDFNANSYTFEGKIYCVNPSFSLYSIYLLIFPYILFLYILNLCKN